MAIHRKWGLNSKWLRQEIYLQTRIYSAVENIARPRKGIGRQPTVIFKKRKYGYSITRRSEYYTIVEQSMMELSRQWGDQRIMKIRFQGKERTSCLLLYRIGAWGTWKWVYTGMVSGIGPLPRVAAKQTMLSGHRPKNDQSRRLW
jgi:hypothetical protein